LFEKEYFGFEDAAVKYVRELIHEIRDALPNRLKRPVPAHFNQYGKDMYYAVFKKNKNTQWFHYLCE
jgi:hypothetical protein